MRVAKGRVGGRQLGVRLADGYGSAPCLAVGRWLRHPGDFGVNGRPASLCRDGPPAWRRPPPAARRALLEKHVGAPDMTSPDVGLHDQRTIDRDTPGSSRCVRTGSRPHRRPRARSPAPCSRSTPARASPLPSPDPLPGPCASRRPPDPPARIAQHADPSPRFAERIPELESGDVFRVLPERDSRGSSSARARRIRDAVQHFHDIGLVEGVAASLL